MSMIQSIVAAVMGKALADAKPIPPDERGERARICMEYDRSLKFQQDHLTDEMEKQHRDKDIWKALPKRCANLVAAFADTLCTLYDDPVTYTWDETDALGKAAMAYWETIGPKHVAAMGQVDRDVFLGGLVTVRPRLRDRHGIRELRYSRFQQHQTEIVPDPEDEDPSLPEGYAFSWRLPHNGGEKTHLWTPEAFKIAVNGIALADPFKGGANPYAPVMPLTTFYNDEPDGEFWAEPAWDLVIANLVLNDLLTGYVDTLLVQGQGTLQLVNGPAEPVTGRRAVIRFTVNSNDQPYGASFVNSPTDFAAWATAIRESLRLFLMGRRIPEVTVMAQQAGESGISIVAQAASLAAYRKRRITMFREREADLICKALRVWHWHETGNLEDFPAPTIKHTELRVPMSTDERDEWDWLETQGLTTAVDVYISRHPGTTREQAIDALEKIAEERKTVRSFGRGVMFRSEEEERAALAALQRANAEGENGGDAGDGDEDEEAGE